MKDYDMYKILYQVKQEERRAKFIKHMINHLLPKDVQELNECIAINNILDNDY